MDFLDSVRGCLLGGAIGDAFGSAYEGAAPPIHIDESAPWVLTDDTQLTLATCEAIALTGSVGPEAIARRMTDWFLDNRVTRLGSGTLKALRELSQGGHWALCGRRGEMAAGCGPAARMAPLAFWLDPLEEDDRRTIRDIARITHHSDEAYSGALAIIAAVRAASLGDWSGGNGLAGQILPLLPDTNVRDRIFELAAMNQSTSLAALAKKYGSTGYVVEAVPLAICAAERMIGQGFFPVMCELIAAGGDTDTIAALAGQIAGTVVGASGLPADQIDRVPGIADVNRIAAEFVAALERRKSNTKENF